MGSMEIAMSTNVAEIEAKIRSLTLEDKTELIRSLIADLDGPADADVESAWVVEAQRRHVRSLKEKWGQFLPNVFFRTFAPASRNETGVPPRSGVGTHRIRRVLG